MTFRDKFLNRKKNLKGLILPSGEEVFAAEFTLAQQKELALLLADMEGKEVSISIEVCIKALIFMLRDAEGSVVFADSDEEVLMQQEHDEDMSFLFRAAMEAVQHSLEKFSDKKKVS